MEITFGDFKRLMEIRKRSVDDLVALFRGKIEEPREFFERAISCRWHGEDRSWVVIPYRSVIDFYRRELAFHQDTAKHQRVCACGCGLPVFDRKKWSGDACRKRAQRGKSETVDSAIASP